jgi:signal peptidase I
MVEGNPPVLRRWYDVRRSTLVVCLLICLASYSVARWVISPVKIVGDSMTPTYDDGAPNYINHLAYLSTPPKRGDIVSVRMGSECLLKRIIGLPGERVEFKRDVVFINGKALEEPYPVRPLLWRLPAVQLGTNDYWVMGDNRISSMLGAVPRDHILGKAMF